MQISELLSDSVFQLNLLLWMAKEQPSDNWYVRPLLHELGYEVHLIDDTFRFPEKLSETLRSSELEISNAPKPDVMLHNMDDKKALYFEAKVGSFGPESSSSKQAMGHLLACNADVFSEVYQPLKEPLLCYLIGNAEELEEMTACLEQLSGKLSAAGLKPGRYSVHGLKQQDTDIVYCWDAEFAEFASAQGKQQVVLRGLEEDTDPAPLFLVCSADDYDDSDKQDFLRRVLIAKIHRALLCRLHKLSPGDSIELDARELLEEVSEGLARFLGRDSQKNSIRLIRQNVFQRLIEYWEERLPDVMHYSDYCLQVCFSTAEQKNRVLEWLEDENKTRFKSTRPAEPEDDRQPTLF